VDEYAGRVLADRYRLPRPPSDAYELVETRAFDTYSGQEVLVRQVLLPEVVTAELAAEPGGPGGPDGGDGGADGLDDSARRALEAARAAAAIPDHPRLVQVFDIFIEGSSLWIASELVSGRPLAALLAERPLDAYRAAEVASDVLTALRALHASGWTHRNVTASTVLVCDDGRAMLGGLAAGAAQEALCGYDPVPEQVLAGADGTAEAWHGPQSALEQERARQNRITVVGAVTERWAPEQAHEVHENWRLSPPVGPAADLWALGSLLFRSVQGHPPFPEDNAAELVQMVCAEPPAFAEECGALRPIVESLLRPDPEERPEAEELGGWLRSLIRSAPEPDLGAHPAQVPTDPAKLPVKRRKGELVRRRWRRSAAAAAATGAGAAADGASVPQHRRHARGKQARQVTPVQPARKTGRVTPPVQPVQPREPGEPEQTTQLEQLMRAEPSVLPRQPQEPRQTGLVRPTGAFGSGPPAPAARRGPAEPATTAKPAKPAKPAKAARPARPAARRPEARQEQFHREPREQVVYRKPERGDRAPRRLGARLLAVVLAVLTAVVLYAVLIMPHRDGASGSPDGDRTVPAEMPGSGGGDKTADPTTKAPPTSKAPTSKAPTTPPTTPAGTGAATAPPDLGADFALRTDSAGFTVAVHTGWLRAGKNGQGQVRFTGSDLVMTVVPGRDKASGDTEDPLAYQLVEPELGEFRASSWSSAAGQQSLSLRGHPAAQGEYTWRDVNQRVVYARNLVILIDGHYHVVLIAGPEGQRAAVQRAFDKAVETYTKNG
jgi:serine/threonine protein kinase